MRPVPRNAMAGAAGGFGAAIIAVVATELLALAWLRHKFFQTSFARSFLAVTVGGTIIASLSAALGILAAA
jgi:hypothetical protein